MEFRENEVVRLTRKRRLSASSAHAERCILIGLKKDRPFSIHIYAAVQLGDALPLPDTGTFLQKQLNALVIMKASGIGAWHLQRQVLKTNSLATFANADVKHRSQTVMTLADHVDTQHLNNELAMGHDFRGAYVFATKDMEVISCVGKFGFKLVTDKSVFDAFRVPLPIAPAGPAEPVMLPVDDDYDDDPLDKSEQYKVTSCLYFVQLGYDVTNKKKLRQVLVNSLRAAGLDVEASQYEQDLLTGKKCIPASTTMEKWTIKCDLASMLLERRRISMVDVSCHGNADKSPQAGHNYLCSFEERQWWAHDAKPTVPGQPYTTFVPELYDCPASVVGMGHGTIADTNYKCLKNMFIDSGPNLDYRRLSVKSWRTDQSHERHFSEAPASMIPPQWPRCEVAAFALSRELELLGGFGREFLLPFAIGSTDTVHICFNPLENRICSSTLWDKSCEHIKSLLYVFGERSFRNVLVKSFFPRGSTDRALMFSHTGHLVDWKWEYMEDRFSDLHKKVLAMCGKFNLDRVKDAVGNAGQRAFAAFGEALQLEHVKLILAGFHSVCKAVGAAVRLYIKSCPLYRDELRGLKTQAQREKRLRELGVLQAYRDWQGRNAALLVHGDLDRLVTFVRTFQTTQFKMEIARAGYAGSAVVDELKEIQTAIASEIDFKLGIMFRTAPGNLAGLYGEAVGIPTAVVNRFILEQIDDYDHLPDKTIVHRVTRQFYDERSVVRRQLQAKAQNNLPLSEVPHLWKRISERAFATVHTVQNEGQHKVIKHEARVGSSSVSPAFISPRLRKRYIIKNCADDDFRQLCATNWNRRGGHDLASLILDGMHSVEQLSGMAWSRKLGYIYGCLLDEQFARVPAMVAAIQDFRRGQALLRLQPRVLSSAEAEILTMLKFLFDGPLVFSLPTSLLDMAVSHGDISVADCESLVPTTGVDLVEFLRVLAAPACVNHCTVNTSLFTIAAAYPERQVRATPSHIAPSKSRVRVIRHVGLHWQGEKVASVRSHENPVELELLAWCYPSTFTAISEAMCIFEVKGTSLTPHMYSVHEDISAMQLPNTSAADCGIIDLVSPLHSLGVKDLANFDLVAELMTRSRWVTREADRWEPQFGFLDRHEKANVAELLAGGALQASIDGFGEHVLAVDVDRFNFEPLRLMKYKEPILQHILDYPYEVGLPKLIAIFQLVVQGWQVVSSTDVTVRFRSGRQVIVGNNLPPAWYYKVLVHADNIFHKPPGPNLIEIKHGQIGAYYECLFKLSDLAELLALQRRHRRLSLVQCQALLDKEGVVLTVDDGTAGDQGTLAITNDDVPVLGEDPECGLPYVPEHLGDYRLIVHDPCIRKRPCRVYHPVRKIKKTVYFDGCTHSSGKQRAFVHCAQEHPDAGNCRRYVFVHNYPDWQHAVGWLVAWALVPCTLRSDHVTSSPPDHEVDVCAGLAFS